MCLLGERERERVGGGREGGREGGGGGGREGGREGKRERGREREGGREGDGIPKPSVGPSCDDETMFNNYRPISILPTLSKVFEKVIFNQVHEHFHVNNLYFSNQYGFRKKTLH